MTAASRLPLLGVRALRLAGLQLIIDCRKLTVTLRRPLPVLGGPMVAGRELVAPDQLPKVGSEGGVGPDASNSHDVDLPGRTQNTHTAARAVWFHHFRAERV